MWRYPWLLVLVLVIGLPGPWAFAATGLIVSGTGPIDLAPHLEVLRDPGGTLTLAEVLEQTANFRPLPGGKFSMGYTRDAFWLRFTLSRTDTTSPVWRLVAEPPYLEDLRLHVPTIDRNAVEFRAGSQVPVEAWYRAGPNITFPIELDRTPQVYYLRVQSRTMVALALELWTPEAFEVALVRVNLLQGLFQGMLATAVLIGLLSALWLRQAFFFAALAYLLAFGGLHVANNGYDQLFLYPDHPGWSPMVLGVLRSLTVALFVAFVLTYLEPKAFYPRLTRTLDGLVGVILVTLILSLFGYYQEVGTVFVIAAILIAVLVIFLLVMMLRHQRQRAGLLLVMFAPGCIAGILVALRNIGGLPANFWTVDLWVITVVLQIPFATLVILLRIREVDRERRAIAAQAQAQQGFLNMIAHELRTPLSVIDAATVNLEARLEPLTLDFQIRFARIRTALARLNGLVNNALAENRLLLATFTLNRQPTAPSRLIEEACGLAVVDDVHELRVEAPSDDRPVPMDLHWLGLAVRNLLDNAIKYSPEGGLVELIVERTDRELLIRVRDHGIGIPPAARETLFDRFFRAENATALPGVSGVGVGLFLVQQVVIHHGGRVAVDSDLGQGSTFTLRIPVSDKAQ